MQILKMLLFMLLSTYLGLIKINITISDNNIGYIYAVQTDNQSTQIFLSQLNSQPTKIIEVPTFHFYAISPITPFFAYTDAHGYLHIVNITTQEQFDLGIEIVHNIELIYDTSQQRSGSLHWSPNGQYLAFVGYSSTKKITNVYVYSVEQKQLVIISHAITIIDNLLDISSWSPDSQWLTIVGRWYTSDGNQSTAFRSAIIARDGASWLELGHEQRSCTIDWSPSQNRLVTHTGCFDNIENIELLIFSFDPSNPAISQQDPLQVKEVSNDTFVSLSYPKWLDNNTLILIRHVSPKGVNLLSDDFFADVIKYEIDTNNFEIVSNSQTSFSWQFIDQNYLFTLITGESENLNRLQVYDLMHQKFLQPIQRLDMCPVFNVRVSSDTRYISFLRGCNLTAVPTLEIIDSYTNNIVFIVSTIKETVLIPLGFIHLGN